MQSEKTSRAPFDDRAALEELERLQQSIQEYRRRREMAEGEFEQFVSSFRKSRAGAQEEVAAAPPRVPAVRPPRVVPPPIVAETPAAPVAPPIPPAGWSPADQVDQESGPAPAVSLPDNFFAGGARSADAMPATSEAGRREFPGWIPWAFVGTAAVLISAVFLMRSGQAPATPDPALSPAPVETPAATPPAVPLAAPARVTSSTPPAEIRTLRSVWVRVTVDGRREVERELEADARIPLPAGRSFVIRAGDAGAVRFLLNGEDQGPLGPDAQVVTRTFTAPAR